MLCVVVMFVIDRKFLRFDCNILLFVVCLNMVVIVVVVEF